MNSVSTDLTSIGTEPFSCLRIIIDPLDISQLVGQLVEDGKSQLGSNNILPFMIFNICRYTMRAQITESAILICLAHVPTNT